MGRGLKDESDDDIRVYGLTTKHGWPEAPTLQRIKSKLGEGRHGMENFRLLHLPGGIDSYLNYDRAPGYAIHRIIWIGGSKDSRGHVARRFRCAVLLGNHWLQIHGLQGVWQTKGTHVSRAVYEDDWHLRCDSLTSFRGGPEFPSPHR